jgi:protein-tyrosine-phosphatase
MLADAGFVDARFHGWTGCRTSPFTQGGLVTASKPAGTPAPVVHRNAGPGTLLSTDAQKAKRILFICAENCNRSQMAEAFARLYGAGQVEAYSAGCRPAEAVHPKAVEAMRELGYDLRHHVPKGLSGVPDVVYDVVVTMGCAGPGPALEARHRESWDIPVPKGLPPDQFRAVRDQIGQKVKELLARLRATGVKGRPEEA